MQTFLHFPLKTLKPEALTGTEMIKNNKLYFVKT